MIERPYSFSTDLHDELLRRAKDTGNAAIDFLFCVPPNDLYVSDGRRSSRMVQHMLQAGSQVWDATDQDARKDFPRGTETFRVVQYASCRGLEGWVVVANALDELWEHQRRIGMLEPDGDNFRSSEEVAVDKAWHWSLIPLTRPIDTLVITLNNPASEFSRTIKRAALRCPDAVEVLI